MHPAAGTPTMSRALTAGLYNQAIWLVCVLGAARGYPMIAAALGLVLLASQICVEKRPFVRELPWIIACVLLGGGIDSVLTVSGHFVFDQPLWPAALAPPWLLVIWAAFAVAIAEYAPLIRRHSWFSLPLFALGAPLTYYAGCRLGAVAMPTPIASLAGMTFIWALLTPALVWSRLRFERIGVTP